MTTTHTHQPLLHPAAVLDPASVESRHRALVEAGTHPMIAEKLANDATANQLLRDRRDHPPTAETTNA